VFENALVNPKMDKNTIFFNNIFGDFGGKFVYLLCAGKSNNTLI